MIEYKHNRSIIRIVASDQSWIEGEAVRQLNNTASLDGMRIGVGLPDLHPGRGNPVGATLFSNNKIYPHIIGNDVGCGIGLWQTSLRKTKIKRDNWTKKLKDLHLPWEGDIQGWLRDCGVHPSEHSYKHGTIGSGNHFAELQVVEKIYCQQSLQNLGLDHRKLFLLVHSGSRGVGGDLFRDHAAKFGADGLMDTADEAQQYLAAHNSAIKWAVCSRKLIARRFTGLLRAECESVLDICHNSIEQIDLEGEPGWLHRKGAAPSTRGAIMIPGSRGSLSYLIEPTGDQRLNLWSLAHGAGRKWNRKSCRKRLKPYVNHKALMQTALGNTVICEDTELLFEEAPQAYKKIETVIHDMQSEGLIKVIATLRPIITYKKRKTK